ncbi:MAG: hypothetical protein ACKV2Q_22615 [Planctomycetaceae bacterium]
MDRPEIAARFSTIRRNPLVSKNSVGIVLVVASGIVEVAGVGRYIPRPFEVVPNVAASIQVTESL